MATLEQYIIDLKALQDDTAHMEYSIDDSFFALLETSEFQKGNARVSVDIKRLADSFEMNFQIEGHVVVICDRCLDEMEQEISTADRLFVKYGSDYADGGDEVVIIPEDEGTINVAWFIYEFMALAVPMRHVHPDGECNPEMMKKLSAHLSNDDVMLDDMQDGEKPIDPRWNDLKNLLDNN